MRICVYAYMRICVYAYMRVYVFLNFGANSQKFEIEIRQRTVKNLKLKFASEQSKI
jgi:hypothetical protein